MSGTETRNKESKEQIMRKMGKERKKRVGKEERYKKEKVKRRGKRKIGTRKGEGGRKGRRR